jgi:hypothetical protein
MQAVEAVAKLDRAFDRGPGADHDLGVRLYLGGCEVVFNPKAIETHYKAPKGGMRTYGAWWRNQSALFAPYPPATQVYTVWRYYPRRFHLPLLAQYFLKTQSRRWARLWLWVSSPWKLARALREAKQLQARSSLLKE